MVRSEKTNKVMLVQLYIYINQNSKTTTGTVAIARPIFLDIVCNKKMEEKEIFSCAHAQFCPLN